jgi:hypothetical protein
MSAQSRSSNISTSEMAYRPQQHQTGDKAQEETLRAFVEHGFACNPIQNDYGEDFFVTTHEETSNIVEPFRLFVQSKGTETHNPTRWTEYVDALTVRNWVLGNELVIVIKRDLLTGEARFCIPEEDYEYFDLHEFLFKGSAPKRVPLNCCTPFDRNTPIQLLWRARLRHYERLIRMCLPDNQQWRELPKAQLFSYELLSRLGMVEGDLLPTRAFKDHYAAMPVQKFESEPGMSAAERDRFAKCCQIIIDRLAELASGYKLSKPCLEQLAIAMTRAVLGQE